MVVFGQILAMSAIFAAAMAALGISTRYFYNRASRVPQLRSSEDTERLRRLEDAVDTIAVEIERMSEAQRFTTKLLVERGEEPGAPRTDIAPRPSERATTPH